MNWKQSKSGIVLPEEPSPVPDHNHYRGASGELYKPMACGGGMMTLPILHFLWGKPWDDFALGFVDSVNPLFVRVTTDCTTTDCCPRRVTVYVDADDIIERITQEVSVIGGSGYEMQREFKRRYGHDFDETNWICPECGNSGPV